MDIELKSYIYKYFEVNNRNALTSLDEDFIYIDYSIKEKLDGLACPLKREDGNKIRHKIEDLHFRRESFLRGMKNSNMQFYMDYSDRECTLKPEPIFPTRIKTNQTSNLCSSQPNQSLSQK